MWNVLWALHGQAGLASAFSYKSTPLDGDWVHFEVDVAGTRRSYDAPLMVSIAVSRALKHIGDGDFDEYLA